MIGRILSLASCLAIAACSPVEQKPASAPAPETAVNDVIEDAPPLCRPADMPAGVMEIGDYAFDEPPAKVEIVDEYGRPSLELELRGRSAVILSSVTADSVGETLDFTLDSEVLMAPKIMEAITGGNVRISGNFTRAELEDIAIRLAPPCPD